jgi:hypothetical protein
LGYLENYVDDIVNALTSENPFGDLTLEYGPSERVKSVEVTLSLSYELLDDDLKRRFRALGTFPHETDYSEQAIFALWAVLRDEQTELKAARDSLLRLFQLSLLDQDD